MILTFYLFSNGCFSIKCTDIDIENQNTIMTKIVPPIDSEKSDVCSRNKLKRKMKKNNTRILLNNIITKKSKIDKEKTEIQDIQDNEVDLPKKEYQKDNNESDEYSDDDDSNNDNQQDSNQSEIIENIVNQNIDRSTQFNDENVLNYFDVVYIDFLDIREYILQPVNTLVILRKIWSPIPEWLKIRDELQSNSYLKSSCGSTNLRIRALFQQPNTEIKAPIQISKFMIPNLVAVVKILDFLYAEFLILTQKCPFTPFLSDIWTRNELCREMLITEYRSFFHYNLKSLVTKLLLNECLAYLDMILDDEYKRFLSIPYISGFENLHKRINFCIANSFPFFNMMCIEAFQKIKTSFPKSGFNYKDIFNKKKSKLIGLIDFSKKTSYTELINFMEVRDYNKSFDYNTLAFMKTDLFEYYIFSSSKNILNIFTHDLQPYLTLLCNSLEILYKDITIKISLRQKSK